MQPKRGKTNKQEGLKGCTMKKNYGATTLQPCNRKKVAIMLHQ